MDFAYVCTISMVPFSTQVMAHKLISLVSISSVVNFTCTGVNEIDVLDCHVSFEKWFVRIAAAEDSTRHTKVVFQEMSQHWLSSSHFTHNKSIFEKSIYFKLNHTILFACLVFRVRSLIMIRTRGVKQHNSIFIKSTIHYIPNNDPNTWG